MFVIVVTGGAGLIGSALIWGLNQKGITDIIVVDHLGQSDKWRNLVGLNFAEYYDRAEFIEKLESGFFESALDAILHMGACSSTTETDADYLMENNYRYTLRIAKWRERHSSCRLVYASSAATYGLGEQGYCDDESSIEKLKPLNMYGYSKQLFDLRAKREGWFNDIAGLKFFNVFGPNEYHKGSMRSVICKAFAEVRDKHEISLFKSHNENYKDGEQLRDFIYVKDVVDITLFVLENRGVNGLFNVGTGVVSSWNDIADAMFKAVGAKGKINYVPMPENLRGKYQYYTCADMDKLSKLGCTHKCMPIEESISDYLNNYLINNSTLSTVG